MNSGIKFYFGEYSSIFWRYFAGFILSLGSKRYEEKRSMRKALPQKEIHENSQAWLNIFSFQSLAYWLQMGLGQPKQIMNCTRMAFAG